MYDQTIALRRVRLHSASRRTSTGAGMVYEAYDMLKLFNVFLYSSESRINGVYLSLSFRDLIHVLREFLQSCFVLIKLSSVFVMDVHLNKQMYDSDNKGI